MFFVPPFKRASRSEPSVEELALRDALVGLAEIPKDIFVSQLVPDSIRLATKKQLHTALNLAVNHQPAIASDLIRIGEILSSKAMLRTGARRILRKEFPVRYHPQQVKEAERVLEELKNNK